MLSSAIAVEHRAQVQVPIIKWRELYDKLLLETWTKPSETDPRFLVPQGTVILGGKARWLRHKELFSAF